MRRPAALLALAAFAAVVAPPSGGAAPVPSVVHYTVESGDTSWAVIVRKHCAGQSTTAAATAFSIAATGSANGTVRVGQIIHVNPALCPLPPAATTTVALSTTIAVTTTVAPTPSSTTTSTTTSTTEPTSTVLQTTTTVIPPTTAPPAAGVLWSEGFASPASMDRLVFDIAFGDNIANGAPMQAFNGDHDHACGSPATVRPLVEDYQVSTHVWYCAPGDDPAKGHFMTGINTEGYVIIAFAPTDDGITAKVFPATANRICWDQNLTELGARKWTQLVVVAADRYAANGGRIDYINPEFNDNGGQGDRAAVRLAGDDFLLNNLRNTTHFFNGQTKTFDDWNGLHDLTDKATRYRICVTDNGDGTVTRTQARPGGVTHTTTGPGQFPAGPRVFILEDDSYNPMKAFQDGQTQVVADPFTWHWDNIIISAVG